MGWHPVEKQNYTLTELLYRNISRALNYGCSCYFPQKCWEYYGSFGAADLNRRFGRVTLVNPYMCTVYINRVKLFISHVNYCLTLLNPVKAYQISISRKLYLTFLTLVYNKTFKQLKLLMLC